MSVIIIARVTILSACGADYALCYLYRIIKEKDREKTLMLSSDTARYTLRPVYEEQRSLWDQVVTEHAYGHLLQSWGWGELKAHSGWRPLRLALWDRQELRYVALAQVLRRSAPHLPLMAGHLAYIPRGPVIDWSNAELCGSFFTQLAARLQAQGALTLRIEPNVEHGSADGMLALRSFTAFSMQPITAVQPLRTILLDLAPSEELLLAQMKEKWRYNVRLGVRKGVKVRVAQTVEDMREWYHIMQMTSERDQFGIHTLEYYMHVWDIFVSQGQARLYLADYEGQLLAGIFVSLFARQGIYLYGASSNEQRQFMPNYVLQWEAMRWAKSQGALSYDLWGIPATDDDDEAMAGVYRFKSGWGGRVVQFVGGYEQVYRPMAMQVARRFMPQ